VVIITERLMDETWFRSHQSHPAGIGHFLKNNVGRMMSVS